MPYLESEIMLQINNMPAKEARTATDATKNHINNRDQWVNKSISAKAVKPLHFHPVYHYLSK